MFAPVTRRTLVGMLGAAALVPAANVSAREPAASRIARFNRGFNLPGWADRPDGSAPDPGLLRKLRNMGFAAIRLPVDPNLIVSGDDAARIAAIVDTLIDTGFAVTVDVHPARNFADLLRDRPDEAADALVEIWTRLSTELASRPPENCMLELLNEPPMSAFAWSNLSPRLHEVVRRSCPDHTILWGAARYQSIEETGEQSPPADENSGTAVHYYWPFGFTHQCADWSMSEVRELADLPFPARRDDPAVNRVANLLAKRNETAALDFLNGQFKREWTEAAIHEDFAQLGRWSRDTGSPVILNEFGVLSHCVDAQSRQRWTRTVRDAAEANAIAWNYWEFDRGFGFVANRGAASAADWGIDMSMVLALLGNGAAK